MTDNYKSLDNPETHRQASLNDVGQPNTDTGTTYERLIELCLIFLIIFTPLAYGAVRPWSIAIFEITAALMAMLWVFKMLSTGKSEFISNPLTPFIFIFILYVSLQFFISRHITPNSQLLTPNSIYSWATKTELLKLISYAMIFLVTLNTIRTKRQITRILSVIITMGFSMSIFYLMRYFGAPAPRGFVNSDHFSAYLGMIIPLSLGFLFVHPITNNREPRTENRFLFFFCIITMSAALFFTMSRGGIFSFIIALLFMTVLASRRRSLKRKRWILSTVAIFIILTIAWLGANPIIEKILSTKTEITSLYFGGRFPIWQGTLNIIKDDPVFGTGLGTFNYIFPKYQPVKIITKHYTHAHSDILELFSETGIVGFLLVACSLLLVAVYIFKRYNSRHDLWIVGLSIGFFGSLTGIFIHSFADFSLHIPANAILLTILFSLFLIVLNLESRNQPLKPKVLPIPSAAKIALYPAAALCVGFFTLASIKPAVADYYAAHPCIDHLKSAIKLDPANATYYYELGKLYSKDKKLQDALLAYQKATQLNPTNSKYRQSLTWTYGNMGRDEEAIQEFEKTVNSEPNNPYRRRAYAIWLFNHPAKENIEKGAAEYREAIALKPEIIVEAIIQYKKSAKGAFVLYKLIPSVDDPMVYLSIATKLKTAGYEEEVRYIFNLAIAKAQKKVLANPLDAGARFTLAEICHYSGTPADWKKSKKEYEEAIHLQPKSIFYRFWYAMALFHHGEYGKSISEHKKILQINSRYAPAYFWIVRAQERQGMLEEAKQNFKQAMRIDPTYKGE